MSASAGRVLLIHKGDYSSGTTYNPMDEVLYEGSTYVCKATSTGNAPTNTTYWQMMAQKGENGSGIPTGGTTGQVPMKASDTDYDIVWGDVETDALSIDEAMEYELIPGKNKVVFNPFVGTRSNVTVSISNAETNEINLNGTSTSSDWICISNPITNPVLGTDHGSVSLKAGTYVLSCPQASALTQHFYISVMKDDGTELAYLADNSSRQFSVNADTTGIFVMVYVDQITLTNQKLQAMICTQEDWNKSHTYEPYYVPVKDSKFDIADQQVLGAWNLAKNTGVSSSSVYDVDFTKNVDDTITANGTNDGTNSSTYVINASLPIKAGTYYLSGGVSANAGIQVYKSSSPYTNYGKSEGSEVTVTIPEDTNVTIIAYVAKNATISNVVLKPMISLEPNQPYVPYAMTNRELTEVKTGTIMASTTGNATITASKYLIRGGTCWAWLKVKLTDTLASNARITFTSTNLPRNILGEVLFASVFPQINIVGFYSADGNISIQNASGTSLAANFECQLSFCVPI